jgi:hypothetical protein
MEEIWLIAVIAVAAMIWFAVWSWRQRGTGPVDRRLGEQSIGEMGIKLPPD